jgi:hypothetical protein
MIIHKYIYIVKEKNRISKSIRGNYGRWEREKKMLENEKY